MDREQAAMRLLGALVAREGGAVKVSTEEAEKALEGKALETSLNTNTSEVAIRITRQCKNCKGEGKLFPSNGEPLTCAPCKGTGRRGSGTHGSKKPREIPTELDRTKALLVVTEEQREGLECQNREIISLLKSAEDALGPDRTPSDRKSVLMVVGQYLTGLKRQSSKGGNAEMKLDDVLCDCACHDIVAKLRAEVEKLIVENSNIVARWELLGDEVHSLEQKLEASELQVQSLRGVLLRLHGRFPSFVLESGEWKAVEEALQSTNVNTIRPPSPEMYALARKAVQAVDAENKMLAEMTGEEQAKYIDQWAERLASDLAKFND